MRPLVYALQFRGQAEPLAGGASKHATAPGWTLATSLSAAGIEGRVAWGSPEHEAVLESVLVFEDAGSFVERGRVVFACGHAIELRGSGRLARSPDPDLRQGSTVWEIAGGSGQFAGCAGRIVSTLLLSDTGDLTEHLLGVVFLAPPARAVTQIGPDDRATIPGGR